MQNFLGIICFQGHASAAALIRDGVITDACIEDRFTRNKQDTAFPQQAVQSILDRHHLRITDISHAAFAWSPRKSLAGQARQLLQLGLPPPEYFLNARQHHGGLSRVDKFLRMARVGREFERFFGACPPLAFVPNHVAHSYSAALATPHSGTLLSVVADGSGEDAAISCFEVRGGRHRQVASTPIPHSFGILYSAVTQALGFVPDSDEYKVMGLSSYGGPVPDPQLSAALDRVVEVRDGRLHLDLRYFQLHRSADRFFTDDLLKLLNLDGTTPTFAARARIARCLQDLLERRMAELIEQVVAHMPHKPNALCTSGGVFLNCLLNESLRRRFQASDSHVHFEHFHFSPIADDNGTALGAAAWAHHQQTQKWPAPYANLALGPAYSAAEMETALRQADDCVWRQLTDHALEVAQELAAGRVVAYYQGRAEFGPRALGSRSILADPRPADMKERMNAKVKLREAFRPYAPSVLAERADAYFAMPSAEALPYMIETVHARPQHAAEIPSVVHNDGTSRVQTVSRDQNPGFHDVLAAFERLTGVPVLLNTSFNLDGQPIVNSPRDAVDCFVNSDIDVLVMGPYLIEKKMECQEVAA